MRTPTLSENVPQVITIVPVSRGGKVSLKKAVREYLGSGDQRLHLSQRGEVMLSCARSERGRPVEMHGNRIILPHEIAAGLELGQGSLVAMIQREGEVALKKFAVVEHAGDRARVLDIETSATLTRTVRTNPMPDELLPRLAEAFAGLTLKHDVVNALRQRETFPAWRSRRLLGVPDPGDEELRQALVHERLDDQGEDGSWEGQAVLTARKLRELNALGLPAASGGMRAAASWLLQRAESTSNPGMFFLSDELVAEQARVLAARASGVRERFRERKRSEMKRVSAGDDLIAEPCGPRIMWPNALVLEALLGAGYERDERVQSALTTLTRGNWCECGYQHGFDDWRRAAPLTMTEAAGLERDCIGEYRFGGVADVKDLEKMDLTKKVGVKMPRTSHHREDGVDAYPLKMPDHLQLCEAMTVRALSGSTNETLRRIAGAHLWRFAGRQHGPDGSFLSRDVQRFLNMGQAALLEIFGSYDHPAATVAMMRSVPWIVNSQNEDGSWGEEPYRGAATYAVLKALVKVGEHLPTLTGL